MGLTHTPVYNRAQEAVSSTLQEGGGEAETLDSLTLVDQYVSLLMATFIECGLLDVRLVLALSGLGTLADTVLRSLWYPSLARMSAHSIAKRHSFLARSCRKPVGSFLCNTPHKCRYVSGHLQLLFVL